MPYRRKEDKAAQMRRYRRFKRWQREQLEMAIRRGDTNLAKQILNTKPSDYWGLREKRRNNKSRKRNSKGKR